MCVGSGPKSIDIPEAPDTSHEAEKMRLRLKKQQQERTSLLGGGISSTIKTSPTGIAGMGPGKTILGRSNAT